MLWQNLSVALVTGAEESFQLRCTNLLCVDATTSSYKNHHVDLRSTRGWARTAAEEGLGEADPVGGVGVKLGLQALQVQRKIKDVRIRDRARARAARRHSHRHQHRVPGPRHHTGCWPSRAAPSPLPTPRCPRTFAAPAELSRPAATVSGMSASGSAEGAEGAGGAVRRGRGGAGARRGSDRVALRCARCAARAAVRAAGGGAVDGGANCRNSRRGCGRAAARARVFMGGRPPLGFGQTAIR